MNSPFNSEEQKTFFVSLSPEDYKSAIDVLIETSQHNQLISEVIRREVVPNIKGKATLLDVGSGPGIISKNSRPFFVQIVAIEPNEQMAPLYAGSDIDLHSCDFADFNSTDQYDVVLCSHVLYHMPHEAMKIFIERLLKYTKPGGICLIAMMADRGENHFLHQEFNKSYINSSQVKAILKDKKIDFDVVTGTNHFTATTREQMMALCRFFVFEDCLSREFLDSLSLSEAKQLDEKISFICDGLRRADGVFRLNQEEDYILIHT